MDLTMDYSGLRVQVVLAPHGWVPVNSQPSQVFEQVALTFAQGEVGGAGSGTSFGTIGELQSEIKSCTMTLFGIDCDIKDAVMDCSSEFFDHLETALEATRALCKDVLPLFDVNIHGKAAKEMSDLFDQQIKSCEKVAQQYCTKLDELSTNAASLGSGKLVEIQNNIEGMITDISGDESGAAERARQARAVYERTLSQYRESVKAWQKVKEEQESAWTKIGEFLGEVGDFFRGESRAPAYRAADATDVVRQMEHQAEQSLAEFKQADETVNALTRQLLWLHWAKDKTNTLAVSTKAAENQASTIMQAVVAIKKNATTLLREAKSVENAGSLLDIARNKKSFVEDIVMLCQRSLFDRKLCEVVTSILDLIEPEPESKSQGIESIIKEMREAIRKYGPE